MKHIIFATIIASSVISMVPSQSFAGLLFFYNKLAQKDLQQMSSIVKDKIKESKTSGGDKSIPIKEALQAVLCRPNQDGVADKILPTIKTELDGLTAWERSIKALVKESVGALKNPRAFRPEIQVSYAIILENLVIEFKPKATEGFERQVLADIKDANIVLTKEAKKERMKRLHLMNEASSPSILADAAIKEADESKITHISAGGVTGPGAVRTPSGEVESGK